MESIRRVVVPAVSIFAMAITAVSAAQLAGWTSVMMLASGSLVRVDTTTGERLRGTVDAADASRVTIRVSGRTVDVPRVSVGRVTQLGNRRVRRFALWGLAIGAGGGAALGSLAE